MKLTLTLLISALAVAAQVPQKTGSSGPALTEQQQKRVMLLEMQSKQIEIDAARERDRLRQEYSESLSALGTKQQKETQAVREQIRAVYAEAVGKDGKVEDFEPVLDKDLQLKLRAKPKAPVEK